MQIVHPLGSNRALPSGLPAVWTVVMPREEACVARQSQNALNAPPELPSITSWEIGSRRPPIRHEQGIMKEGRAPQQGGGRAGAAGKTGPIRRPCTIETACEWATA